MEGNRENERAQHALCMSITEFPNAVMRINLNRIMSDPPCEYMGPHSPSSESDFVWVLKVRARRSQEYRSHFLVYSKRASDYWANFGRDRHSLNLERNRLRELRFLSLVNKSSLAPEF